MSSKIVNTIANRLSLRKPQRDSLEILHNICEIVTLEKDADFAEMIKTVQSEYPHIKSFDRDFFSLCFALATGVGKTRLMGAFISYLHLSEGINHFMVIAPNLTIYNKLIEDFKPNTPKYVFKGIGEFAQNTPEIITGDNYETGIGVKSGYLIGLEKDVHINIFNISKITDKGLKGSNLAKEDSKRNIPRMRRLCEFIGESYFEYLAGLDDLVILMDESHRYRASAGMNALNELKPILGLELTATPHVEKGQKTIPFKNVIYDYPLSTAMDDGYVKEPAVATRENFVANKYSESELETIKLQDGVRIHENTKVELQVYASNNSQPYIKPFLLVVAKDTKHANKLKQQIEDDDFFEGQYKGKVITVHSGKNAEEKDDVIQQLLTVEAPDNPVEIVIHVNMLKEGWDVTNLYTIVPLRAANSKTLVEQSIGRGLRLPYGKRVGVPTVDRLTIVSHDKFEEIIDHANDPNSIIRVGVIIGKDLPDEGKKLVETKPAIDQFFYDPEPKPISDSSEIEKYDENKPSNPQKPNVFKTDEEKKIARATIKAISSFEYLSGSQELEKHEVQEKIVKKVFDLTGPLQGDLPIGDQLDVSEIITTATKIFRELTIDIPKIVVTPVGKVSCRYEEFELDVSAINLQPVSQDILIQQLKDREQFTIENGKALQEEKRLEDYLVRSLIDFDDISYDDHADILYDLSGQVVKHIQGYLKNDEKVLNVVQYNQKRLAELIHAQMQEHFIEEATSYETHVTKGFTTLKSNNCTISEGEESRDFRVAIPAGQRNQIRSMIFNGFEKCLYTEQKFDSDPERRFAVIVENDKSVQKWFKPGKGAFQIYYNSKDSYEPDFVIETETTKYLCEPKQSNKMDDEIVLMKAKAAVTWCEQATVHCKDLDNKQWKYLLIPHDEISEEKTLDGLAATFSITSDRFKE